MRPDWANCREDSGARCCASCDCGRVTIKRRCDCRPVYRFCASAGRRSGRSGYAGWRCVSAGNRSCLDAAGNRSSFGVVKAGFMSSGRASPGGCGSRRAFRQFSPRISRYEADRVDASTGGFGCRSGRRTRLLSTRHHLHGLRSWRIRRCRATGGRTARCGCGTRSRSIART